MGKLGLTALADSRIEQALTWLLRVILLFLLVSSLVTGSLQQALAMAAILAVHVVVYVGAARLGRLELRVLSITLADILLTTLAFYVMGDVGGPATILGFCLAALVAARVSLWWALALNAVVWLLFALPYFYQWLGLGASVPLEIARNLLVYLTLTYMVSYLTSSAMRQGQADERLQARVDQLTALQRTTRELNATPALDRVLQVVLESAIQTTNATHGSLLLIDVGDQQLALRTAQGYSVQEEAAIRESLLHLDDDDILHQVLESGQPHVVDDVEESSLDVCTREDTRSALASPIFFQGMVVGLIHLCHTGVRAFDDGALGFVQALAEQAALAIGNALRFEEQVKANTALSRRTLQMDSLLTVGQKLRADVSLEDTLEEVAHAIQETVGYDYVVISVVKGEPPMLHRMAAVGLPPGMFQEMRQISQPVERYAEIFREQYRQGLCFFYPFQERSDWEQGIDTHTPMSETGREWREGQWHPDDMLLAPLRGSGGRLLGYISVDEPRDGRRPSRADLEVLAIFASQAAVAVENARLFAAEADRRREAETLQAATQALSATLDLQEILDVILRELQEVVPYDSASVQQLERNELRIVGGRGFPNLEEILGIGLELAADDNPNHEVVRARAPLIVDDAPPVYGAFRHGPLAPAGTRSWMGVPLLFGDDLIGMITLDKREAGFYSGEHARLALAFAAQAAVAMENARLFEQVQRRVAEQALVTEIGQAISGALDAEQLADLIYTQVSKLLDTRNFYVALYDAVEDTIVVSYLVEDGQRQPSVKLQMGQGLTSHLVRTGQPILLTSGTDAFQEAHGLVPVGLPAKSWLGVPMIAEDRVIGGIVIQSYEQEEAFDEGHLNLLRTVAGQAAIAYQNASLFEERERRIVELAALNEMSQAISSALELEDLLEVVYQQVSHIFDTSSFYIATYEFGSEEWNLAFALELGERVPATQYEVGAGLTGYIIHSGRAVLLKSLQEYVEFHQENGIAHVGERAKSWLGVPLAAADEVVGVMAVQSYAQEHLYGEPELAIFTTIAAQVAVAIRNASLYRQIVNFSSELEEKVEARTRDLGQALRDLTAERDRAETLYRITSELGATLDLEQVLRHALDLFADALQVEHGTITLLDPESGYLELRAVLGPEQERAQRRERTSLTQGVGLAGWTLEHRKPALVPDVTEDERWSAIDGRELGVRSVVAAPLSLGGGDIVGVLTLGHSSAGYFTQEHLQLVTAAAAQIAIAVNNSDLYAYIIEQADQLGTMLQAQESEAAKNRAILESIADGVLVLDHNGRVLLVNPAAEELLGLSAMVIEGEHFRHILGLGETAVQRDLAQALYHELRSRLETVDEDLVRLQPASVRLESEKQVLAVNIAPLIVSAGGTPGLVAALRDASREAEVERLKNEFISTVSHELRTPMTSIKGYTDLLFLGMVGGLTDAQRNFLQIIKSNADRLTALVNDILDISRIETGRLRLTVDSLDLSKIISEVVVVFQEQYREKGLALEWEEVAGLPKIRGDADRVTQVLNNLIANSWQYTPSGGRVSIAVHSGDGFLQVDVADTGIGIGPDDIDRVFDRFYRVDDPAVEEVGGTGLGLSIVKMFVELLGGRIWLESELGVGTTFSFTLPLVGADVPEVSLDLLETDPPVVGMRREKILVVEDNHDLALLLRRQLESEGYQVLLAGSGEDAIWLAREEKPQLITLDIMLPDLDGFTVLERLKEHPVTAPIPVVIVSILSDEDKGYALGAIDYVAKPIIEDKLLISLQEALAPTDEGAPRSVLVVDDEPDIRGFLEQVLSYHGYGVRTAADGQAALAQVGVEHPDLILLDLKMPGVDGYEVIRRLKAEEDTRPIPIIVITASPVDKERDKVRVLGMGATQYLAKPFSIKTLIDEIKKTVVERPSQ